MQLKHNGLIYGIAGLIGLYFLFLGLVHAQAFLIPLTTAIILALVMLPLANKMERWIFSRGVAALVCTLLLFIISLAFFALISFQVKTLVDNWPEIKEKMGPKVEQLKAFAIENTPIEEEHLDEMTSKSGEKETQQMPEKSDEKATAFLSGLFSFTGNYLLTFIYVFFLLNYRKHFKKFLLQIFPEKNKQKVKTAINESVKVAPNYLAGKAIMIALLSVLYSIGLGISGVQNFILVSILAAVLSLIPYIGNIIGFGIALVLGYLTTGETGVLIGIILTFGITQFVESYLLEPFVVGDKVDLHPFFVIAVVVIGNLVWGIVGMIIFIPLLAIVAIVLKYIPGWKPVGDLLSKKE